MESQAPITYLLLRTDLPLEHQMVQAIHAGMGAAARFGEPPHNHLALLSIPDQATLENWAERITLAGHDFHIFHEPDDNRGWTALCTQPLSRSQGKLFRKLRLWCPEQTVSA